jgi:hypothetical protein
MAWARAGRGASSGESVNAAAAACALLRARRPPARAPACRSARCTLLEGWQARGWPVRLAPIARRRPCPGQGVSRRSDGPAWTASKPTPGRDGGTPAEGGCCHAPGRPGALSCGARCALRPGGGAQQRAGGDRSGHLRMRRHKARIPPPDRALPGSCHAPNHAMQQAQVKIRGPRGPRAAGPTAPSPLRRRAGRAAGVKVRGTSNRRQWDPRGAAGPAAARRTRRAQQRRTWCATPRPGPPLPARRAAPAKAPPPRPPPT